MPACNGSFLKAARVSPSDTSARKVSFSRLVTLLGTPSATTGDPNDDAHWSPSLSSGLYRTDGWGAPYFTINSSGNVSVLPHGKRTKSSQEIDLLKIVKKASDPKHSGGLGLQLPLIIRFPDVLKNRLESLQSAFEYAIKNQEYSGHYQGIYPVKSNQDRSIVEDIVKFRSPFRFGLEVGSKPELLLAMTCLCKDNPEAYLICNGFKDREYVFLAFVAMKLALNCVIVLEREEELQLVLEIGSELSVRPVIGLRAKLRTKNPGLSGPFSGKNSKFGLTAVQILRVVKKLETRKMLDCLQLLHFHIGSQIPTIELLTDAVTEAAQIYCELVRFGAQMRIINTGGGLGVDYDGSKSSDSEFSVGYGLEEYALAVVRTIQFICDRSAVEHPVICSESGRAIVSYQSVLIFETFGEQSSHESPALSTLELQYLVEGLSEKAQMDYQNLISATTKDDHGSCLQCIERLKQSCVEQFKEGTLEIDRLVIAEEFCELLSKAIGAEKPVRRYNVNMSVFASIPDVWGTDQLFPIMPIHRLDERPSARGILLDLTLDSDGRIDRFIGGESNLPLHEMKGNGGGYYLGMFLGGAYQEAIGCHHCLLGSPSVVRVRQSDSPQGFQLTSAALGPSCQEILQTIQCDTELIFEALKHRAQEYAGQKDEENDEKVTVEIALIDGLSRVLKSMPYLVNASPLGS